MAGSDANRIGVRSAALASLLVCAGLAAASTARAEHPEGGDYSLEVSRTIANSHTTVTGDADDGISCGADCTQTYPYTENCTFVTSGGNHNAGRSDCSPGNEPEVNLTAAADGGFTFAGWSGAGCSGTGACSPALAQGEEQVVTADFDDVEDPAVTPTSPDQDSVHRGTITFSASASDNDRVSRVDFYRDRSGGPYRFATDSSAPYSLDFETYGQMEDGPNTVYYVAIDGSGRPSARGSRDFTIDNTGPSVRVTSPADDDFVRGTVEVQASVASDPAGVNAVFFYADGSPFGSDTTAPYAAPLDTTQYEGDLPIVARAYDNLGNSAPARPVWVRVDNAAPSVAITGGPESGSTTDDPTPTFSFSGDDNETTPTFTCSTDSAAFTACSNAGPGGGSHTTAELEDGSHTFTVRATDGAGHVSAASRSFTVQTPGPTNPGPTTPASTTEQTPTTPSSLPPFNQQPPTTPSSNEADQADSAACLSAKKALKKAKKKLNEADSEQAKAKAKKKVKKAKKKVKQACS